MSHTFSEEEQVPDFVRKYVDAVEYEGYPEFLAIAREHKKAVKDYDEIIYPRQMHNLRMETNLTGENKTINRDVAINSINETYKNKALELAKSHGYKEEVFEKDFDKNQEKMHSQLNEKKAHNTEQTQPQQETKAALTKEELKQKFREEMRQVEERNKQHGKERER